MKNRKDIKKITVLPKATETFARRYDSRSRLVLGYTIDVSEDVRHMVRDKRTKTGTYEQGLEQRGKGKNGSPPQAVGVS